MEQRKNGWGYREQWSAEQWGKAEKGQGSFIESQSAERSALASFLLPVFRGIDQTCSIVALEIRAQPGPLLPEDHCSTSGSLRSILHLEA
jgi:hypothetical protein